MAKQKAPQQRRTQSTAVKAAAAREAQRRRERRRVLVMGGAIAAVLVIVIGVAVIVARAQGGGAVDAEAVPATSSSDYGLVVGDADAPSEMIVYEDFLCPACGAFEAEINEDLTRLAADGDVLVEYRPFVLLSNFDYSERAVNAFAVVLEESGPEVAKAFHDALYADQPSESAGEFPDDDWLVERAVEAGAEEDAVRPGIEGMSMQDWVDEATAEAADAGVTGTPTVLVDDEQIGGGDMGELVQNTLDAIG